MVKSRIRTYEQAEDFLGRYRSARNPPVKLMMELVADYAKNGCELNEEITRLGIEYGEQKRRYKHICKVLEGVAERILKSRGEAKPSQLENETNNPEQKPEPKPEQGRLF